MMANILSVAVGGALESVGLIRNGHSLSALLYIVLSA